MKTPAAPNAEITLDGVRRQFELWRENRTKRTKIPNELWKASIALCLAHSITKVSKELGVNYADLKRRVEDHRIEHASSSDYSPHFVEWNPIGIKPFTEYFIEMEDRFGGKMKIQVRGEIGPHILELGEAFWRKGE